MKKKIYQLVTIECIGLFRSFQPPLAEEGDWYDPVLNPFSDNTYNNSNNSDSDADHYETIDEIQLAVAALARQEEEEEASNNEKSNVPKFDKKKKSSGYSKSGSGGAPKLRPPKPKRPTSVTCAHKHTVTTVETQTSFDKEESAVIPKIVISQNDQKNTSQEEAKT